MTIKITEAERLILAYVLSTINDVARVATDEDTYAAEGDYVVCIGDSYGSSEFVSLLSVLSKISK